MKLTVASEDVSAGLGAEVSAAAARRSGAKAPRLFPALSLAQAPSKQAKIARAMQAAPESISKNATIVDGDGTVLRWGSNGWHCHPAAGPRSEYPMCNDEVWMRLMTAIVNKADFRTDRVGISYMLAGDDAVNNADPYDVKRDPGEVWVQEGLHLMIVVPDAKTLEGIPDDPGCSTFEKEVASLSAPRENGSRRTRR